MKKTLRLLFTILFLSVLGRINASVIDNLTFDKLGLPDNIYYGDFSGKYFTSNAVYAGNAASANNKCIQLRSTKLSGIITTSSGGKLISVTVTFVGGTKSGRTLDIYGSNVPYTSSADLYSSTSQGKHLGAFSYDGKTTTMKLDITPDNSSTSAPSISGSNPFMETTLVSLTNPNASGNIYYTTDGTDPTTASTLYDAPFTIAATTTVKAVVVDGANRSVVASAFFFKTDHAGTQADPYTAAEAYDMITGGVNLSQDVYVKGIVYSSNNLSSGTITYYITPDGSSTNQVQVYNGKSFDGADFTNTDNVGKGDEVVVKGGFLYYNNTRAEIINSQLVSIVKAPIAVTFGSSGYASLYYSGLNLTVPSGVVASGYKLSSANTLVESVTWTAGEVIPAGTAVLMQAAEGTYDFVVAESATKTDAENILLGTDGNTTPAADANAYFYKFALDNNGQNPGFYWGEATGATFKMSAHKAYLKVDKSAGAKTVYGFGHEATGISRLPVDGSAANGPVYNVSGQRVDASYKGLIIRNGKKMIRR